MAEQLTRHPSTAAVVLAAGKGTRFRSETSKVLHRTAGRSLLGHVMAAVAPLGLEAVIVVVAADGADVEAEVAVWDARMPQRVMTVVQPEQRGTGDALDVALAALPEGITRVLVLPGDTPLLRPVTLAALLAVDHAVPLGMLTAELDDPTGYGRVLRDGSGRVTGVVEDRDASAAQREVHEVNAGMYVLDRAIVQPLVAALGSENAQSERYLTDVVAGVAAAGGIEAVLAPDSEVAGVNDRVQLAAAGTVLHRRRLDELMRAGVSVIDPANTYVDVDVDVGLEATLLPGTTRAEDAVIGDGVQVGPFAHLRPGTVLGADARVGAFVQTKNVTVGAGAKLPHLAYVGDAEVGPGANVACGVVTVNYDGREKHRTIIGEGAFIGCGSMLVAPVRIGDGAFVGAGSTITEDVPDQALAIARARQVTKEGRAAGRLG